MKLQSQNLQYPLFYILLLGILPFLHGCASAPSLSFQGTNLDPRVQTMNIDNFDVEVANGPANLGINFTERLREYFQRNTRLGLISSNGHLSFAGTITKYEVTPVAPSGQQTGDLQLLASRQRLTIGIKVQYTNSFDESQDFDQEFSFFADFDQNQTLIQVEQNLIPTIINQIILDIFNKSVANW
jgi:hypothetical protein